MSDKIEYSDDPAMLEWALNRPELAAKFNAFVKRCHDGWRSEPRSGEPFWWLHRIDRKTGKEMTNV